MIVIIVILFVFLLSWIPTSVTEYGSFVFFWLTYCSYWHTALSYKVPARRLAEKFSHFVNLLIWCISTVSSRILFVSKHCCTAQVHQIILAIIIWCCKIESITKCLLVYQLSISNRRGVGRLVANEDVQQTNINNRTTLYLHFRRKLVLLC